LIFAIFSEGEGRSEVAEDFDYSSFWKKLGIL